MDAEEIKNIILDDVSVISKILEDLGMHHIQLHNNCYTFGLPDGDNPASTSLYLDDLGVKAYTRKNERITDIIDLVVYVQRINKTVENPNVWTAVLWLYEELGIKINNNQNSYKPKIYQSPFTKLKEFIKNIMESFKTGREKTVTPLQTRLNENTLISYVNWNNTEFLKDNISEETQTEFELEIDVFSHRITIPIRDELGRLVGIKGRRVWDTVDENNPKYIYLKQCRKSEILYGLDKTLPYIKKKDEIIICESEKGVMQLWTYGVKNSVAIGSHNISKIQLEKIIRINASNIVIAFDKDVSINELLEEYKKLCDFADVTCIVDRFNLLEEKESPMDTPDKWNSLYKSRRYKFDVEKGEIIV